MRKFKVGDRVKCIGSISLNVNGPEKGKHYRVVSVGLDSIGIYLPNCKYDYNTKMGIHANWGSSCFVLSNKPITETDYLDAIKENFSDGI